jgi:hypothetical protein
MFLVRYACCDMWIDAAGCAYPNREVTRLVQQADSRGDCALAVGATRVGLRWTCCGGLELLDRAVLDRAVNLAADKS